MVRTILRTTDWLADRWCYLMHPDPMWPIHGRYLCRKCQRSRAVPWANTVVSASAVRPEGAVRPIKITRIPDSVAA